MSNAIQKLNRKKLEKIPKKDKRPKEQWFMGKELSVVLTTKVPGSVKIQNNHTVRQIFADSALRVVVINCAALEEISCDEAGLVVVHECPSLVSISAPVADKVYTTCENVDFAISDSCEVIMDQRETDAPA